MNRIVTLGLASFMLNGYLNSHILAQPAPSRLPAGTVVWRDLPYVTNGHDRQKLDLFLPREGDSLALIINIHGGAFRAGSKEQGVPWGYLAQGYAVASINYRLSQHAAFPAQIEDCKAAVRWLRAHAGEYRLDPDRFAVWGSSAGGHLAAMVGTAGDSGLYEVGDNLDQSSQVQAVVDYFGPTDFLQMDGHRLPTGMWHDPANSPESQLIGGAIQENKEKVARANPITYITPKDPPFLICHGDRDPLVPHHQSELLDAALKTAGVPVSFYTVKGGGHGGWNDPNVAIITRAFLDRHLKEKSWRIMAVGDSITEGGTRFSNYRYSLLQKLTEAGYRVEFVGSRSNESPAGPLRHEGYGGKNAEFLAGVVAENFKKQPADIVLIHAGHNHFAEEKPVAGMVAATEQLIGALRQSNPAVIVLLAQVIPSGKLPKYGYIPELNEALAGLAERLHTAAQPVILVNQADGFDWETDTIADKVHPNAQGAEKMAERWFETLVPVLTAE